MDTDDDPISAILVGTAATGTTAATVGVIGAGGAVTGAGLAAAGVAAAGAAGAFSKTGSKIPGARRAKQAVKTAKPVEQISEQARKNKRMAASFLTRGFAEPKLSQAGLLGF